MDLSAHLRLFRRSPARRAAPSRRPAAVPRLERLESRDLPSAPALPPFADTGTGLLGHYFRTPDLSDEVLTRTDATVNFNWTGKAPAASVPGHDFSVRWTGEVQAPFSETYTFSTRSDDGVRLWVDGRLLIDDWHDHAAKVNVGAIALSAGRKYDIQVEYYENAIGPALIDLSWSSASQPKEIIPQSQLYPGAPDPARLSGFVYVDSNNDGLHEVGEPGAAGVGVMLTGTDDQGDAVTLTTTTAADGAYQFLGLRPGDYTVQAQFAVSGGVLSPAPAVFALPAGATLTDVDFIEPSPPPPPPPAVSPPSPPSPPTNGGDASVTAESPPSPASPSPPDATLRPTTVPTKPVPVLPPTEVKVEGGGQAALPAAVLPASPSHDTVPIAAAAPVHPSISGGGGGAAPDVPTVPVDPPPPAATAPAKGGPAVPPTIAEEEEEEPNRPFAHAHAQAADEVFAALGAAPHANDLFAERVPPPARLTAAPPPPWGADPVEQRAFLMTAWILTTLGAALAGATDDPKRDYDS